MSTGPFGSSRADLSLFPSGKGAATAEAAATEREVQFEKHSIGKCWQGPGRSGGLVNLQKATVPYQPNRTFSRDPEFSLSHSLSQSTDAGTVTVVQLLRFKHIARVHMNFLFFRSALNRRCWCRYWSAAKRRLLTVRTWGYCMPRSLAFLFFHTKNDNNKRARFFNGFEENVHQ